MTLSASDERMGAVGVDELARRIRVHCVEMTARANASHVGGALSARTSWRSCTGRPAIRPGEARLAGPRPLHPQQGARVRRALRRAGRAGFFPLEWLETYYAGRLPLAGHVTHKGVPGVEVSTGSLGHGLPVAAGMALAARARRARRTASSLMLSDGECDEGSNWEAILFAPHHRLDNLVADRRLQQDPEPRARRRGARPRAVRRQVARLRLGRARGRRPRPRRDLRRRFERCRATPASRRASSRTPSRARASASWRTSCSGTTARRRRRAARSSALARAREPTAMRNAFIDDAARAGAAATARIVFVTGDLGFGVVERVRGRASRPVPQRRRRRAEHDRRRRRAGAERARSSSPTRSPTSRRCAASSRSATTSATTRPTSRSSRSAAASPTARWARRTTRPRTWASCGAAEHDGRRAGRPGRGAGSDRARGRALGARATSASARRASRSCTRSRSTSSSAGDPSCATATT